MVNDGNMEVYFCDYCKKCKYKDLPENYDPFEECLASPMNYETHKPIKFEEAE